MLPAEPRRGLHLQASHPAGIFALSSREALSSISRSVRRAEGAPSTHQFRKLDIDSPSAMLACRSMRMMGHAVLGLLRIELPPTSGCEFNRPSDFCVTPLRTEEAPLLNRIVSTRSP